MNEKQKMLSRAIKRARGRAIYHGKPFYVVYEDGIYEVASEWDMETFHYGAQVVFCAE